MKYSRSRNIKGGKYSRSQNIQGGSNRFCGYRLQQVVPQGPTNWKKQKVIGIRL